MYLYRNEVLIVRNSHKVVFFKLELNEDTEIEEWVSYYSFEQQGRLSGNKTQN